ncbi:MAG TPA: SCO family protein [Chitinophagales bacterium]|nr:SCO family protein [Chitinophagales bacterium]
MSSTRGRIWTIVMLVIILVLPSIAYLMLREGLHVRESAPASDHLIKENLQSIPTYSGVSFRGDTISKSRMKGKVCVLNFTTHACEKSMDDNMRKLFEIQEDYYGKTISFRIITNTLDPDTDGLDNMRLMSERYAGREIWHFITDPDSSGVKLYDWCKKNVSDSTLNETDTQCPQLVYLVDGNGKLRGVYNILEEQQFHDLYNDILYLVNQMELHEQKK